MRKKSAKQGKLSSDKTNDILPMYEFRPTTKLRDIFSCRTPGRVQYREVRDLIRQKADPNVTIGSEPSILHDICNRMSPYVNTPTERDQIEFLKVFKFLLHEPNIDVHRVSEEGENLLIRASLLPDSKFFHVLLQESYDVYSDINHVTDTSPFTPLNRACGFNPVAPPESIQYLIDNGADCDIPGVNGITPLTIAIKMSGHAHHSKLMVILNELFRKKANANIQDNKGRTALHWAIHFKQGYSVYVRLLQGGASIDIKDKKGKTPEDMAEADDDYGDVRAAIERFSGVQTPHPSERNQDATGELQRLLNSRNDFDFTYREIKDLLMRGADPDVFLDNGCTFLHNFCRYLHEKNNSLITDTSFIKICLKLFRLFLDQPRIQLHAVVRDPTNILYRTLFLSRSDFLQTLIMQKHRYIYRDINLPSYTTGYPPLHFACKTRNTPLENVRYLLDAGADCNLKTKQGHTPLRCAVLAYNDKNTEQKSRLMFVLNELFRNKADPNIQGKDGRTVLHDAVATGKGYDVCTRLLEAGARFDIRDANQQTAMDLAIAYENYEQQEAMRADTMKQDRRIAASMAMDAYVPRELHSTITNSIPHRMF
jgi:ankyrin repeat protein